MVRRRTPGTDRDQQQADNEDRIVADLIDWIDAGDADPPANVFLITGPSKTADIEMNLVTGVHGPGEVHVLMLPAGSGK